jgi:hypothetical protein
MAPDQFNINRTSLGASKTWKGKNYAKPFGKSYLESGQSQLIPSVKCLTVVKLHRCNP